MEEDVHPYVFVKGSIVDSFGTPLEDVRVMVFDASNDEPYAVAYHTDRMGEFNIELPSGNYYFRLSKQGFYDVPAKLQKPKVQYIGMEAALGFSMYASNQNIQELGIITGRVLDEAGGPLTGALVVAKETNSNDSFSGYTDADGIFVINNVVNGNFEVQSWKANYVSSTVGLYYDYRELESVIDITTSSANLQSSSMAVQDKSGFGWNTDFCLLHPETGEYIPGTWQQSSDGIMDVVYSEANEYKFDYGLSDLTRTTQIDSLLSYRGMNFDDFAALGTPLILSEAIAIIAPSYDPSFDFPATATTVLPTFSWFPVTEATSYSIEVKDLTTGALVWGNIQNEMGELIMAVELPSTTSSIQYNYDGSASFPTLIRGRTYSWRVYAIGLNADSQPYLLAASNPVAGTFNVN